MAISLDEALGMSLADEADESIHVDVNTRQITIPESQKLFGVESDADVEVKHIVIDGRYADGNRDLSKLAWRVVYCNAKKRSGYYLIPSVVANKNSIEMDWLIKRSVVAYKGTVDFILCAFATTSSGEVTPEWNSTLGQGIVLKGLETSAIDIGKESVDELSKILYETVTAKDVAVSAASNATANAAESEKAAKASEQAAAESAQAALESKTAAATSEVNAAASAKKAQDVADSLPEDYTTAVNEIAALKQQVANITPDDSAIGGKPWSSKHIIDMLCPPLEESGNPVVCYPVAGYALGVKAKWEPMQEGTGTPSPENIRPIHGRDSVQVERCGENLLNPKENAYSTYTPYGLTINYIGDNKVHLKGTYNLEGGGGSFDILDSQQKLLAGRNLKITGFTIEGTKQTYRLYGLRTKDETAIAMNSEFADGDVIDMTVAIVVSKDTPTTYTPYNGQTNTLTLPETVYGGEVDTATGDGKETWKLVTLDGTEKLMDNGSVPSRKEQQWALYDVLKPYSGTFGISSHFDNTKGSVSYPANFVRISKTSIVFHVASDGPFATVDALKSYLAAQYAAGTPVQIAYKLEEPVPFTATGAQSIPALAGANTVLTDADSATVTGRADPIKRITDLEAAVASIN